MHRNNIYLNISKILIVLKLNEILKNKIIWIKTDKNWNFIFWKCKRIIMIKIIWKSDQTIQNNYINFNIKIVAKQISL